MSSKRLPAPESIRRKAKPSGRSFKPLETSPIEQGDAVGEQGEEIVRRMESALESAAPVGDSTNAMPIERDEKGRFLPGQAPISPGRSKGLTRLAREATDDGRTLIAFARMIFDDESQPFDRRKWAAEYLSDRGYGKATLVQELSGAEGGAIEISADAADRATATLFSLVQAQDAGSSDAKAS